MDKVLGWYRTARNSILYEGLPILFWRVVVKLLSPVAEVLEQMLFEFDLTQPIEQLSARVECHIGQATEADIEALVDQRLARPPPDDQELSDEDEYNRAWLEHERAFLRDSFRRSFRAGELCFVARVGDEFAHTNWIRFYECAPVASRPVSLGPGEAYFIEGFTIDKWRGKRVHQAVNSHMLRYAQSRGYRLAFTITDLTKAASRRGLLSIGWRRRGQHLYITPRRLGRSWMVPLGGDVSPIVRDVLGVPLRS